MMTISAFYVILRVTESVKWANQSFCDTVMAVFTLHFKFLTYVKKKWKAEFQFLIGS